LGIISEWEFFSQQKIDGGNWEGGGRRAAAAAAPKLSIARDEFKYDCHQTIEYAKI